MQENHCVFSQAKPLQLIQDPSQLLVHPTDCRHVCMTHRTGDIIVNGLGDVGHVDGAVGGVVKPLH